jgi:hypothetical protein
VKIDAFCHIMPRPYYDRFFQLDATQHSVNLRSGTDFATSITAADVEPWVQAAAKCGITRSVVSPSSAITGVGIGR